MLYHNTVCNYPYDICTETEKIISKDIPRTNIVGSTLTEVELEAVRTLLTQYVQTMPCDGYLQGFNYIVYVLYDVYKRDDDEHAMADAWWSMVTIVSIIRPMIPDHDPTDFAKYTKTWSKHYIEHLQRYSPRTHHLLTPFYDIILPSLTVKWLMIWFTQMFAMHDVEVLWDALITCDPRQRTKLMAIIAANITIQHADSIIFWAREHPSEIGPRLLGVTARDAKILIDASRHSMLQYKLPGT